MLIFFVLGDILGAGIYALVGEVGAETGGAIWAPFLLALFLAVFTAFSYAELVTKYPRAAGAALYVNRAFRMPFLTFVVAFAVLASGLASAATIGRAFGGQYLSAFVAWPTVAVGLGFLAVIAAINLRGIRESMRFNFALTLIEVAGLLLVVVIGVTALTDGFGDPSRVLEFDRDTSVFMAILGGAGIAFFALIGFEDSVNLAEEARRPRVDYPWALFGGLMAAGAIYLAVTLVASMVVPVDRLASSSAPLLEVTSVGPLAVPDRLFSAIALFALANGELVDGIATLMDSPSEYWLLLLAHFSFLHLGVRKILTLMAVFDATSAQVVTSMRKVITFALSFVFFPHGKSFTMLHAFGICLSLGAAFILEHGRTRKASL